MLLIIEGIGKTVPATSSCFDPQPDSTLNPGPFEKSTLLDEGIPTLPRAIAFLAVRFGDWALESSLPMTYRVTAGLR